MTSPPPPPGLWHRLTSSLLDASIYYSFDASGFRRHSLQFTPGDLAVDLTGKVCLVTGANSGIGFATARGLAERGAEVGLLCRNPSRGQEAVVRIREAFPSAQVWTQVIDMAELSSVRAFAERWEGEKVDVLVHNAGMMANEREVTAEGFETTLATHVLGPFLLTRLLLPRLRASSSGRVLTVSSGGMYARKLDLAHLDNDDSPFDGMTAYARAKRIQVVLNQEWGARHGERPWFAAMHPGWADTPAVRSAMPRFHATLAGRLRTAEEGADTVLWLACRREVPGPGGGFWFDRQSRVTHLLPYTQEGPGEGKSLWDAVSARCGLS